MNELDLFVAAVAIANPVDRGALLDRECAGRADLRRRLDLLLEAHGQSHDILDLPNAPDPIATGAYAQATPCVGTIIAGRYKLLEEIGDGGMGTVWMAEQREPVKRLVAVKLIKAGLDSKAVLARFEAERQALALMDHPNIAQVLDAGTSDDGRPFFVMELVKGLPLTDYCDARRLSVNDRLDLFVQICSAVQHAHQKAVIHRDLKPSNILVTEHDGKPLPKVIDFGLAKALNASNMLTDRTLHTAFGTVVGTPLYMAPEQVGINALDVDTRTDIYALGVILYELLTGSTPLERARFKEAAWEEVKRVIREEEPPRPSTRLSSEKALPSLAANRQAEPAHLRRLVSGDLDWIVMKALDKDRSRRYETANGLAKDVQRHLAGDAVEACPPTLGYRLKKFVRRYRPQVIAAGLVLMTLVAGVIGTTAALVWANRAAEEERQAKVREAERAEGERQAKLRAEAKQQEAERNLAFAKKGNEILGSVFTGLDPKKIAESGRPLQDVLRENLTKAVKELEGSAIGDPLEVAAMQNKLGVSLIGLGEAGMAVEVFQKELDTRKAKLGPDHPDTLMSVNNLATALEASGQFAKAVTLYEETLARRKSKLGPDHPDTLGSMNNLASAYQASGQLGKALPLFEEALEKKKAKLGPDHPNTLTSMNNLASALQASGQFAKAVTLHEETLVRRKAKLGPDHPNTLTSMNNLATALQANGQFAKAVTLFEEVLEKKKAKLGPDHPSTLNSMNNLAGAYKASGQLTKAVTLYQETLEKRKAKLGPDHPSTLTSMNNLAGAYQASGQLTKAVTLYENTLESVKAKLGPDHPSTLKSMNNLALAYIKGGQLAKAESLLRESPAIREKAQPDSWNSFHTMTILGRALVIQKKYADAEPLLLKGYEGMLAREETIPSENKNAIPEALDCLIDLYSVINNSEAVKKYRELRANYPMSKNVAPMPK
jgi:tetratricopeptide (TPR) repeat protein